MTYEEYQEELAEKAEDARIFKAAHALVRDRLIFLQGNSKSQYTPPACNWAGATGIVDLLDVVSNQMESMTAEFTEKKAEIVTERPKLSLVPSSEDEDVEGA